MGKLLHGSRLGVNQMEIFTQKQQLEDGRRSGRVGVSCCDLNDDGNEANNLQPYQSVF